MQLRQLEHQMYSTKMDHIQDRTDENDDGLLVSFMEENKVQSPQQSGNRWAKDKTEEWIRESEHLKHNVEDNAQVDGGKDKEEKARFGGVIGETSGKTKKFVKHLM